MEDDMDLHYADDLLPTCILQNLSNLWKSGTLCDVLLAAEGRNIAAHKIVLAAASPYFRAMFTSKLREAIENKVEMQEMSFKLLHDVLNFIYTSELKVTDDNVYDLMSIGDILQLSSLRTACASFLTSSLNTSNCLSVLKAASMHNGYNDLENASIRYARRHLCDVAKNEEFFAAPVDVLLRVFQGRVLNVPDEGFLLKIIISWVKHDPYERLKDLDKLSSAIHLFQVPMDTLVLTKQETVVQNSSLESQIKHTINSILEERYDSDVRTLWAAHYKERARRMLRFCDDQEVILALGGESNGLVLGSAECLTLGYDNWKCVIPTAVQNAGGICEDTKVIPTMKTPRSFFGVCYSDEKVYVAGGATRSTPTATGEVFNINRNEWTSLPTLPKALIGVKMAFLHGQLVVSGGLSDNISEKLVLCLDEKSSNWKVSRPMTQSRSFHGLVSVGGMLYAIGGKTGDGTILNSVERYDPCEKLWFKVSSLHEGRYDFGCVAIDHYIYVAGGIGGEQFWLRSVERYDTITNQWCYMTPMSIARASFGITVSDSRIYCVGGYNGVNHTNTVEKFNPRTNRWHCVQAMQNRRYGVGAATLRVPVISREKP